MRLKNFALSLAAVAACALAAAAAPRDRLTVDLLLDWEYVQSPQVSPDGQQIVYTRRWTDKVNDRYEDEVWIMQSDGSRNRFLMKGSQPRWSPDGRRLAYVAPGSPSGAQLFVKWMDAPGETQLTHLERSPGQIQWSPDGRRIAFTMLVPATGSLRVQMPQRPSGAKWVDPPRVVDRLDYRADNQGFRPEGYTHIFVVPDTGGTPRQLTAGDFNHGAPEWMPDSQSIVFSALREPEAEYFFRESEIYALDVRTGSVRQLTRRKGPDSSPAVSPDGKLIAYLGHDETDDTYVISKLHVMNADGTGARVLTAAFDRQPAGLEWAADGSGVYFVAEDRGSANLHFAPLRGGAVRQVTQGVQLVNFSSMSRDGLAAATITSPHAPADVAAFNVRQPAAVRRLTNVNEDLLEGRRLGEVEEIWYDSVGQKKIQGWIVKPPDFDASKKYPLLLYIHGGPHAMYGVGFNFEFQNHAAEGYVVLYTNPRGSSGYGAEFGNAIKNNYPGEDYDDLMNGVDAVIRRGYVDERNLFVTGGSGGGVLTAWIVGHTDRFAAAVSMKPVINWYSFVGTTDGSGWYRNFRKLPWEDPAEHLRRSPITYVGNVKTPTMLLTGELDLRTPMEQTEQYYRALKMRKVPTAMVRLPDEYHGFNADWSSRHPSNRIAQILYLRAWFDRHKRK
jgi:dipeptidyl aminopeptidase/acylaminoacyl peptidase